MRGSCHRGLMLNGSDTVGVVAVSFYLAAVLAWMSSITLDFPASTLFTGDHRSATCSDWLLYLRHGPNYCSEIVTGVSECKCWTDGAAKVDVQQMKRTTGSL